MQKSIFCALLLSSFLNSIASVNRGYWDPSETTVTKYTTTYASELTARNLTHDFTGLSTLLLGQAQPKQFQSVNDAQPTGWWWESKVSDDGAFSQLSDFAINKNTEMPRSYYFGSSAYFNWFAATAETGTLSMTSGTASDSICPKGWSLPVGRTSETKSFRGLFAAYNLSTDIPSMRTVQKEPFFIHYTGEYNKGGGIDNRTTLGIYWTSSAVSDDWRFAAGLRTHHNGVIFDDWNYKPWGMSIRCVKK